MFINDVGIMKFRNPATMQKWYRAVVSLHGIALAGEHPTRERTLHRRFATATRARAYGEKVMERLKAWVRMAEKDSNHEDAKDTKEDSLREEEGACHAPLQKGGGVEVMDVCHSE